MAPVPTVGSSKLHRAGDARTRAEPLLPTTCEETSSKAPSLICDRRCPFAMENVPTSWGRRSGVFPPFVSSSSFLYPGKIHTKFSTVTVCKCAVPGHQAHSPCCTAATAVRLQSSFCLVRPTVCRHSSLTPPSAPPAPGARHPLSVSGSEAPGTSPALVCLAPRTEHSALEVRPRCGRCQDVPPCRPVTAPCVDGPRFI